MHYEKLKYLTCAEGPEISKDNFFRLITISLPNDKI